MEVCGEEEEVLRESRDEYGGGNCMSASRDGEWGRSMRGGGWTGFGRRESVVRGVSNSVATSTSRLAL